MNEPKFPICTITNFGRVTAFLYRFSRGAWSYTLHCEPNSQILYKSEDKLEFLEHSLNQCPEPTFALGDSINNSVVAGIMQHSDCGYSYYLSEGRDTPYIHWIPQESILSRIKKAGSL